MFSTRLPASLVPTPLAAAVAARRRRPGRLLDLTLSNPTTAGLAYPETLATAFSNAAALHYDPDPRGLRSARSGRGLARVDRRDRVARPPGADGQHQRSLFAALQAALRPRRSRAGAVPELPTVRAPGPPRCRRTSIATRFATPAAGSWTMSELEPRSPRRTRALIVSPRTTRPAIVPTRSEWDAMATLCRRHGLALIVDEVFSAYPLAADATHVRDA